MPVTGLNIQITFVLKSMQVCKGGKPMSVIAILYARIIQHCIFCALKYKEISQCYEDPLFHWRAVGEQKTGQKKKNKTRIWHWCITHLGYCRSHSQPHFQVMRGQEQRTDSTYITPAMSKRDCSSPRPFLQEKMSSVCIYSVPRAINAYK